MALPAYPNSPTGMTMAMIRTEIVASNAITLNDTNVRTLCAKSSGVIAMYDAFGKCWSNCACVSDCGCAGDCGCNCPAPEVPLTMADGSEKLAGDIVVGDVVKAWDEENGKFVNKRITYHSIEENQRMFVRLSSGRNGEFAANHRFLTDDGFWKELRHMPWGQLLHGGEFLVETKLTNRGPVVAMIVEDVHTYVTLGVISHNTKA